MASKLFTFVLLVLGATAEVAGPDDVLDLLADHVSLLQTAVETKKSEAKAAVQAAADEAEGSYYASGASKAASLADGICSDMQPSLPVQTSTSTAEPMQADLSQTAKEAPLKLKAKPEARASWLTLGTLLEAMACLLIMDVVRRSSSKNGSSDSGTMQNACKEASAGSDTCAPLLAAALAGDEAAFEAKLSSCPSSKQLLSQVDIWGCTALHYAAKGGSAFIAKRLVDLGARVDARDAWDETPLHLAASAGHAEVCEALLEAGAAIDSTNAEECSPLIVAGRENHEVVCNLLVRHGAGVVGMDEEMVPDLVAKLLKQQ